MSEWNCEHMRPFKAFQVPKADFDTSSYWHFCPICGTPRPEPKKGLAEKLLRAYFKPATMEEIKEGNFDRVAQAALEHFSEIVDEEFLNSQTRPYEVEKFIKELKNKFKESI